MSRPGAYSPEVLAHFRRPQNLGSLPLEEADVGAGEAGDLASGRLVRVHLRLAAGGTIGAARFKAYGCPATIACASLATERADGAPLEVAERISAAELAAALQLASDQHPAAEVVVAALRAALRDLRRTRRSHGPCPSGVADVVCSPPRPFKPPTGEAMSHAPKSQNITWSHSHISRDEREKCLGHGAATVWFTGLSGSGKSTVAIEVERQLVRQGVVAYVLDGDNVRHGLNVNLAFSPEDRTENIRRIGEVAKLFNDAGVVVLTAFISPYKADRDRVRTILPDGEFIEVLVDCPLEVCEGRDEKGLYSKARAGEIPEFTGISAPYEPPERPELVLETSKQSVEECAQAVLDCLRKRGIVK